MINEGLNKEDIKTFVKEFDLFKNHGENISIEYFVIPYEFRFGFEHRVNVSFDCLKVFKENQYDMNTLWGVNSKIQDDFKVVKNYLLTGLFSFLTINTNQKNLNKWKNTELKKLRDYVKNNHRDVHSLQLKYRDTDLYPRIKITFKRNSWRSSKWTVSSEIQNYAHDKLGFSRNIRVSW